MSNPKTGEVDTNKSAWCISKEVSSSSSPPPEGARNDQETTKQPVMNLNHDIFAAEQGRPSSPSLGGTYTSAPSEPPLHPLQNTTRIHPTNVVSPSSRASTAALPPTTPPDSGKFSYYAFHPHFRLFIAASLTACNFLMYGEDPIVHSYCEAELPVLGHTWGMLFLKYPGAGGVACAKVVIWLICVLVGLVLGRLVFHHMILRNLCGVPVFGWKHLDDDDLRTTLYNPRRRENPYNVLWWWGGGEGGRGEKHNVIPPQYQIHERDTPEVAEEKQRLQSAFRLGVSSAKKKGVTQQILSATEVYDVELLPSKPDYDREEYQQTEETFLEAVFPFYFHPRKHRDHSKGSLLVTSLVTCLVTTFGAVIYNNTILTSHYGSGADFKELEIGPGLGLNEWQFGKSAAVVAWLADLLNLLVATDSILQELNRHHREVKVAGISLDDASRLLITHANERPRIAAREEDGEVGEIARLIVDPTPRFKLGYFRHYRRTAEIWMGRIPYIGLSFRVVFVWVVFLTCTGLVLGAVVGDLASWDDWQRVAGSGGSTEVGRIFLAAVIAIQGPMTVAQDWEWPSFSGENEVHLPGVEFSDVTCERCCCTLSVTQQDREGNDLPKRRLPFTAFHITNKWVTFIPFFLSLCLDFSMLYACYEYAPGLYGQYTNPDDEICSTRNTTYANEIKAEWEANKINIVNYTERVAEGFLIPDSHDGIDFCMPARFVGTSAGLKLLAALPGFAAYVFTAYYFIKFVKIDKELLKWESSA